MNVTEISRRAKEASFKLASLSGDIKNRVLEAIAAGLEADTEIILAANAVDLAEADRLVSVGALTPALRGRLKLDGDKLCTVIQGVRDVLNLPNPVNQVLASTELGEGLRLDKVSCPIGVIGVIFEARPDVIAQIVPLTIKSANAVILKGGREAANTNLALMNSMWQAVKKIPEFPADALHLLHGREEVAQLLKQEQYVDLIIPRGGNRLMAYIKANTVLPVLGHADGVCHIYVAPDAPLESTVRICVDAKTQYPAACNAVETLLVDKSWPDEKVAVLLTALKAAGVNVRAAEAEKERFAGAELCAKMDWHTEYGDLTVAIKTVESLEEAIAHINTYGSHHTDCILTQEDALASRFMAGVDSAGVYHNVSTRFADGFRYGFGAEVGISTNKTHARGPVGLDGLTIYKYKLYGSGQTVAEYTGPEAKKFTHRQVGKGE